MFEQTSLETRLNPIFGGVCDHDILDGGVANKNQPHERAPDDGRSA